MLQRSTNNQGGTSINILMSATSYPRSEQDWQGIFIRHIADALATAGDIRLSLWAPDGPRNAAIDYRCSEEDRQWLAQLAATGGIAHLLRRQPLRGLQQSLSLLYRQRRCFAACSASQDLFHINWLQNALALGNTRQPALITVLGSDFKLLALPGMKTALRRVLRRRPCLLAPNAEWMVADLERWFGDVCQIQAIPFGIDQCWYDLDRQPAMKPAIWLAVVRVTADKIGPLFDWGQSLFTSDQHQLHLIGPNQQGLAIPDWVHYHGPATQQVLLDQWFPQATGMITLSQHSEGRPQVLLEAMAAGLPIIASAQPAHRDMLVNGQTGLLVDSEKAFAAALAQLLQPAENRRIGRASRQAAQSQYGNWRDCADRYRAAYATLLERG